MEAAAPTLRGGGPKGLRGRKGLLGPKGRRGPKPLLEPKPLRTPKNRCASLTVRE